MSRTPGALWGAVLTPILAVGCETAPPEFDCVDLPVEACDVTPGCRLIVAHRARIDDASGFSCWEDATIPVACQPDFDEDRCPRDRTQASGPSTDLCLLFDDVCLPEDWGDCASPAQSFCPQCETRTLGGFVAPSFVLGGQDGLGRHLAIGDLDDDGTVDLVANSDAGVTVFFGPVTASGAARTLTLSEGDAPTDEEVFLAVGDLDADGVDDLVVGAPSAQRIAATDRYGQVAWHPGPLAEGTRKLLSDAALRLEGSLSGYELGGGLAIAELTGDDTLDLLVVARGDDTFERDGGAILRIPGPLAAGPGGLVQAFWDRRLAGGDDFGAAILIQPATTDADAVVTVEGPGGVVGEMAFDTDEGVFEDDAVLVGWVRDLQDGGHIRRMARGDVDGDGQDEIVVGLPDESGVYERSGRVAVISPKAGEAPDADLRGRGRCLGDALGAALAVGDLDGDGVDDVIVGGSAGANLGGLVLYGPLQAGEDGDVRFSDDAPRLGASGWAEDILLVDLDGDDVLDVIAGSPSVGEVQVYLGKDRP